MECAISDNDVFESTGSIDEGTPRAPILQPHRGKYFNDPVHDGYILGPATCAVVDTPPFQRLRHLKQLGFVYYVYPGASHNRFEHSLGVAHLAGKWATALMQGDRRPHEDFDHWTTLVEMAGLCHDLGHGPFSHTWERYVLPSLGVHDWHHEEMGTRLVDYIFDQYGIGDRFCLNRNDVATIQNLILGNKPSARTQGYGEMPVYLYDIVNNKTSGVDVDKLDYLRRDSLCTNVTVRAPYRRFLHFAKADDRNILFRMRELENVLEIFRDRMEMHKLVYTHKTSRAMDLMLADALKEIGPELGISRAIREIPWFLRLRDSLLEKIEESESVTSRALRAKQLIHRMQSRDLYTLCGEMVIPESCISTFRPVDPVEITSRQRSNGVVDLRPEDICVSQVHIDCGLGGQNPLDRIRVYQQRPEEVSVFAEEIRPVQRLTLRVYCKERQHEAAVREAFESYKLNCSIRPVAITPPRTEHRVGQDSNMSD